ncbi:MAG: hypothetical protein ABSG73_00380 [Candidatus Aminicenantales bacterium]|jgi:hypothetical protein
MTKEERDMQILQALERAMPANEEKLYEAYIIALLDIGEQEGRWHTKIVNGEKHYYTGQCKTDPR